MLESFLEKDSRHAESSLVKDSRHAGVFLREGFEACWSFP